MAPEVVRRGPGSVLPVPSLARGGGAISAGAHRADVPAPPVRQEPRAAEKTRQRRAAVRVPSKATVLRKADARQAVPGACARRAVHESLRGPAGLVFSRDAVRV